VYRNEEQLNIHLAAPYERLDKCSGCKYVTSAAPAVQAEKAMTKKAEEHRSAILVRPHDALPTHALELFPTAIHPRKLPASPCTHSLFAMRRPCAALAHALCRLPRVSRA
jgi:hypothetical protein